ncbi:SurA N-terminal domain-containing protein [bacterium]|nr:SurA N-terminal domain-containing protein [candidate division CSSED10-310 bacterium]
MKRILHLFFAIGLGVSSGHALHLDRFAAIVNGELITESMIEMERAYAESCLVLERSVGEPDSKMQILDRLINRQLIVTEALRFLSVPKAQVDARMEQVISGAGGRDALTAELERIGMSEIEFQTRIRSMLLFDAYIDQRIRAFIQVRDRDVDAYIRDHAGEMDMGEMQDVPDEKIREIQELVRKYLLESKVNDRLEEIIQELRKNADIKILIDR